MPAYGVATSSTQVTPKRSFNMAPGRRGRAAWPNLFYWNEVDKGGHFAAFKEPAMFATELWRAFRDPAARV